MKKLDLTKIGFFNPGRLTDEEIERSFITRIAFFQYIFKKIIAEKANSIPQHHLVIGQRGMGKTSLLVRIAVELRKKPYSDTFIPLTFPEEQYNIDRLSKFWLNCLDALANALDREKQTVFTKILDAEIDGISKSHHQENNAIYAIFEQWTKKIGRRPVLLVDNLNLIFDKISKEEQHQLRAILMSNNAPILLGASATTIEDTVDYGAAFYDAFQIQYLKKLTFEESLEVLKNLAKITGKTNFEQLINQNRGRLGALYQLTGGTPRTISMLFPLIQDGFSEEIQSDLDALLDVVTPLYKARFEELPAQLQVVLDAIALHWEPTTIEQVRHITQLENAQLSPQLKRLVDVGWLQKLDAFEAKGAAYELSERFFNIWYLMRRSSREQKRELYCLSKFLESMYGEEVEGMAHARLGYKNTSPNQAFYDLALADTLKNKALQEKLKNKSYAELLELSMNDDSILKNFTIPENAIENEVSRLFKEATQNYEKKSFEECLNGLKHIIKLDPANSGAYYNLGIIYSKLSNYEKSENAYLQAIAIDKNFSSPWNGIGNLYQEYLLNYEKAEKAYLQAIAIDKNFASPWNGLGNLYHAHLGNYGEAEKAYLQAIAVDKNFAHPWNGLGNLYQEHLSKYEEAEKSYLHAIAIDKNLVYPWNGLGFLYMNHLSKYEEAEKVFLQVITIDKNNANSWNGLGYLYKNYIINYKESEKSFFQAIAIDKNYGNPWNGLGDLYQYDLGNYEESEKAYLQAIATDKDFAYPWNGIGNLYQDHLSKYKEAEKAYLQAIEIDNNFVYPKYNVMFLYRDKLNRIKEAKAIFETILVSDDLKDCYLLHQALFAYYENNAGIAKLFLEKALTEIKEKLPYNTQGDWWRAAATAVKLGFGNHFLQVLQDNGYDVILRPYYVAIQALMQPKPALFFNSIAAEVREPAKKIMEMMKKYLA